MSIPKKRKLNSCNTTSSFQIANGLSILRKSKAYALEELQDITGIHRHTLNAYEHNIIEPCGTDVFIITSSLGISIDDFYQFAQTLAKHSIENDLSILIKRQKNKKFSLFEHYEDHDYTLAH